MHLISDQWNVNEITWEKRTNGDSWNENGGDVVSGYSAKSEAAGFGKWEEYDVTEMVKKLLSGDVENHGFLLETWEENAVGRTYASSDDPTAEDRPKLTVVYDGVGITKSNIANNIRSLAISVSENTIKFKPHFSGGYNISIISPSGKAISKRSVNNGNYSMNVSNFAKGVYILSVEANGIKQSTNFIIK